MILVAAMVVPANAATTVLYPKDNIFKVQYSENNLAKIYYHFDVDGYISIKARTGGQTYTGYGQVDFGNDGSIIAAPEVFLIRVFPLGASFAPGGAMPPTVVDVTDFKSRATFNLKCMFEIDAQYVYQALAAGDTNFYFLSDPFVCFYDKNGVFIDQITVNDIRTDITLEDVGNVEDVGSSHIVDVLIPLTLPEGAAYFAPCIISYLYPPDTKDSHSIGRMGISSTTFFVEADKNLLVEQSETLEAVEEQIEELNGKADTIINGTPEMSDQNEQMQGAVTDQKDEMNAVEDAENEYIDQWEESNNDFKNKILSFLKGTGWVQLSDLLSPFMDFENWIKIMVMVVAFVNLSVILFGR